MIVLINKCLCFFNDRINKTDRHCNTIEKFSPEARR